MSQAPEPTDPALASAQQQRARMGIEIEALQATLVRLLQDVLDAETRLGKTQAAQLVEANEQLMMTALASQEQADTAAMALAEAEHATTLDALTKLPNRTMLVDRFGQAMAQARRHHTWLALLFVDLDDFKRLNDRHGHGFGDRVLREVARRLASAVREGDTVSRHGGDEFLILLAELQQPADAIAVADKLVAAVGIPLSIDDQAVSLTASVGVALYPDDGEDLDALTAHADAAMFAHKRSRNAGAGGTPGPSSAPPGGERAAPADDAADPVRRLADLREANERLVLAALDAQELRAAAERARQRQSAFMAAVADELGNPMAPIRIATTMLGRLPGEAPLLPRVQQVIEQQLAQMARLVGRLVDASATDGGGLSLDRAWVDLAAVVDDAVATYRPIMQRHRMRLAWQPPPGGDEAIECAGVIGDAARLKQVVTNLLDNACTHTPDGGWIGVTLSVGDDSLTLTVADDGIGITAQALPEVFEPFVLDVHALDFNGVGLGIGLTVARALVHAHGGRISAHSGGIHRGSQFVITLPRVDRGADVAVPAARAGAPAPAEGVAALAGTAR